MYSITFPIFLQLPYIPVIFFYCSVCRKISCLAYINEHLFCPVLTVFIVRQHFFFDKYIRVKIRKSHKIIFIQKLISKTFKFLRSAYSHKLIGNYKINRTLYLSVPLIILIRSVIISFVSFYYRIAAVTEYIYILISDKSVDLYICTVISSYGNRFILPVPLASFEANEICSEISHAGISFSAFVTL